jgi:hypothetical protein
MLKVMGNSRKALDWYLALKTGEHGSSKRGADPGAIVYFFSLTVSLILEIRSARNRCGQRGGAKVAAWPYMVLNTPTFPFVMPPIDLKTRACQNEVEKAKPIHEST